jgi:hypothetical protein
MKRFLVALVLLSFLSPALAETLPTGTPIQIALDKEVDHDEVKVGEVVPAHVIAVVKQDGKVVFHVGTPVKGTVTRRKNNSICGVPGSIELGNFKISGVDGQIVPLTGNYQRKGDSHIIGSLVGAYFILFPLFIKGQDGIIESGAEATMYTAQEWAY